MRASTLFVLAVLLGCSAPEREAPRFPRATPPPPHRDVSGPKAEAVFALLEGVADLPTGSFYTFERVDCSDLRPFRQTDPRVCALRHGGREIRPEPPKAAKLFDALQAAGAMTDVMKVPRLILRNVRADRARLSFDDHANYNPTPRRNITLERAVAEPLLRVLADVDFRDEDGTAFILCVNEGEVRCELAQRHSAEGAKKLDLARSLTLWRELLRIARSRRPYDPQLGALDDALYLVAMYFTLDDDKLQFELGISAAPDAR